MDIHQRYERVTIAAIVSVIILISGTLTYIYLHNEGDEYLTVKEAMEDKKAYSNQLPIGTVFHIKDKVLQSNSIKLPKTGKYLYDYTVYPNETVVYTVVFFESLPDYPLFFMGNRTGDFPEGNTVRFDLEVRPYEVMEGTDNFLNITESKYVRIKMMDVVMAMYYGEFAFVSMDVNYTGNGTFVIRVKDLFLPTDTPIYWSTVTFRAIPKDYCTEVNPKIQLFSSKGEFLGNIGKERNSSIEKEIEIGDYLIVRNVTSNITFYLNGDAFSSFDSPYSSPYYTDMFSSAPLFYLHLYPDDL